VFAYSDGQPVAVFDVEEAHPLRDRTLRASASTGVSMKVAVVRGDCELDFDETEWPELLATAYEMFVDDPEVANDCFQWVKLEVT
jgi:hypothetical protein